MNLEKFTERSRGFIQAAQTIAMRESHQRLAPEHILKALMDDEQGLASNLIQRAGGAPQRVVKALDGKLAKIQKVSGDAGQVYLDSATGKVLDEAEKIAKKAGDSFVPVERLLTALALTIELITRFFPERTRPIDPSVAAAISTAVAAAFPGAVVTRIEEQP